MKTIQCALLTITAVACGSVVAGDLSPQSLGPVRDANGTMREGMMYTEADGGLVAVGLAEATYKAGATAAAIDYGYFGQGLDEQIFFDDFEPPCSGVTPPGLTRLVSTQVQFLGSTNVTQFTNVYGAFPGSEVIRRPTIAKNTYVALEFTPTGNVNQLGTFSFIATNSIVAASITISECPGDFRPKDEFPQPLCALDAAGNGEGSIKYILNTNSPGSLRCQLTTGKKYYLNIINANLGYAETTICPATNCTPGVKNAPNQ